MVVNTNDEAWTSADKITESGHEKVLQFLKDHEGQAFHERELADEIHDAGWENAHEEHREIQRIGEDEFYERKERGQYNGKFDTGLTDTLAKSEITNLLRAYLDDLHREGKIEVRYLPQEATDIPYEDFGDVLHYTYSK